MDTWAVSDCIHKFILHYKSMRMALTLVTSFPIYALRDETEWKAFAECVYVLGCIKAHLTGNLSLLHGSYLLGWNVSQLFVHLFWYSTDEVVMMWIVLQCRQTVVVFDHFWKLFKDCDCVHDKPDGTQNGKWHFPLLPTFLRDSHHINFFSEKIFACMFACWIWRWYPLWLSMLLLKHLDSWRWPPIHWVWEGEACCSCHPKGIIFQAVAVHLVRNLYYFRHRV